MAIISYSSGFLVPISVVPVQRCDAGATGRHSAVHAQLVDDFELGPFTRKAGQLLCGAAGADQRQQIAQGIDCVTCASCRALVNRWARDALLAKYRGFAIGEAGSWRAVAAKSTAMAAALLGVSAGVLARRGEIRFPLGALQGDDQDTIRAALGAFAYGTVLRQGDGPTPWVVEEGAERAELILRQQMASFATQGRARVDQAALQRNRSIRLTQTEADALKALGGASWARDRIKMAKKGGVERDLEPPTVTVTIRTTDAQWDKVRALGGCKWIRSVIQRAIRAQRQSGCPSPTGSSASAVPER